MIPTVPLIEIFSSLQGEGTRLGERHLFVRFQDCELSCKFCDTPLSFIENRFCRVESPAFSKRFKHLPNPLSVEQLNALLSEFNDRTICVTGGEPLQKASFLGLWLPTIRPRFKILLETAGVHVNEFRELIDLIDIVSMDFKLPSATGMHPWWREHEAFLKAAQPKEVYVKAIVSAETKEEEILRGASLVASIDPAIPFILQPATPTDHFRSPPSIEQISQWQQLASSRLPDVRVIPQMHKQLGTL